METISATRKLLAPYDPGGAEEGGAKDFLVPAIVDGTPRLECVRSVWPANYGMVVYLGRDITVDDVLARMIDSGRRFGSVIATKNQLAHYFEQLKPLKIGTVVEIVPSQEESAGFSLAPVEVQRQTSKRLP